MKFVDRHPFADPDAAARKLVEIANGVEAVQDGRTKGYAVRVTDRDGSELYRTPVDQIPPWLRSSPRRH